MLLPSATGNIRQAIISAASYNLPPEIEFLKIAGSEDLERITALVKNKPERFSRTLPAKYMEHLRAAKAKPVKTNQLVPKKNLTNR